MICNCEIVERSERGLRCLKCGFLIIKDTELVKPDKETAHNFVKVKKKTITCHACGSTQYYIGELNRCVVCNKSLTKEKENMNKVERNKTCNFQYMRPNSDNQNRIETVRTIFKLAEKELREVLNASRETSLVWTNLEQACMFAIKGICLDGEFSDE